MVSPSDHSHVDSKIFDTVREHFNNSVSFSLDFKCKFISVKCSPITFVKVLFINQ